MLGVKGTALIFTSWISIAMLQVGQYLEVDLVDSNKELYFYLGNKIKEHREQAGLTQSELAQRVGVTRNSIASIEKGRQGVLIHTLHSIASALGIPSTSLLPPDPEVTKTICEVCGFDYFETYGEVSRPLLEAKHITMGLELNAKSKQMNNGLCLCGNCQELFSFYSDLTIAEFKKRVKKSKRIMTTS
jgi:transcriptional regulator with XRE-family HTH domain